VFFFISIDLPENSFAEKPVMDVIFQKGNANRSPDEELKRREVLPEPGEGMRKEIQSAAGSFGS
jgi:hypothetical protein